HKMETGQGYEKAAHLYDLFDDKDNIDFFYQYAKEVDVILDIGAGTGRIAIPIAERGISVVCIEPSPAMRNEFRKKIKNQAILSDKISLITADAQSFKLNDVYPAAILSGSFDHFLDDFERVSSLWNINHHLKIGGKLIFDVWIGLMKDSPLHPAGIIRKGNYEYHRFIESKILPNNKIEVLLVFRTYKEGKLIEKIEQKSFVGIISRERVHQLLEETEFRIVKEYGNYNFSPYMEGDPLLIIEAVKKE
ncbi:MAG: class I SAM-dependent methyltransferase, partial [Promethearchaeota archaeon]